jgi:hypothetical protein
VARIGDEIGAHPLGRRRFADIAETSGAVALPEGGDAHRPAPVGIADAADLDLAAVLAAAEQPLEGRRVAHREPYVAPLDPGAEHRARRRVGEQDAALADEDQGLGHRLGERARPVLGRCRGAGRPLRRGRRGAVQG